MNNREENTSLENAIKEEALRVLEDIAHKEAEEIKRLDEACRAELEDFKKRTETQTDSKIRQETSRLENRATLDLKKFKLKTVEAFIGRALEEVQKGIRDNPGYKSFLITSIASALRSVSSGAEVRLKSEDLVLEPEVRWALKTSEVSRDLCFVEDKTIRWGGCIVTDSAEGRIFDSSIDRICFRKSAEIRREVMKMMESGK